MELRDVALANGIGRIVLGSGLMLAPRLAGGSWVGDDADRPGAQVFASALGARDVALGAGLVWALQRDQPAHAWLVGAALSDAVDFTRTLLAGDEIPKAARAGVLAVAGASAVGCALLSAAIDD